MTRKQLTNKIAVALIRHGWPCDAEGIGIVLESRADLAAAFESRRRCGWMRFLADVRREYQDELRMREVERKFAV